MNKGLTRTIARATLAIALMAVGYVLHQSQQSSSIYSCNAQSQYSTPNNDDLPYAWTTKEQSEQTISIRVNKTRCPYQTSLSNSNKEKTRLSEIQEKQRIRRQTRDDNALQHLKEREKEDLYPFHSFL